MKYQAKQRAISQMVEMLDNFFNEEISSDSVLKFNYRLNDKCDIKDVILYTIENGEVSILPDCVYNFDNANSYGEIIKAFDKCVKQIQSFKKVFKL